MAPTSVEFNAEPSVIYRDNKDKDAHSVIPQVRRILFTFYMSICPSVLCQ